MEFNIKNLERLVKRKNEKKLLPIKDGSTVFVAGPAANDIGVQCGGWTKSWQGSVDMRGKITEGTTILEGLYQLSHSKDINIVTDEKDLEKADVMMIFLGEIPYAEWEGDSDDISITGSLALSGNETAIEYANNAGIPVVAVILAGRNVMISDYIDDWDSVVMAYLPGTEGQGVANVLLGEAEFTGKLAMPWYKSVEDIEKEEPELLFDVGYGLTK